MKFMLFRFVSGFVIQRGTCSTLAFLQHVPIPRNLTAPYTMVGEHAFQIGLSSADKCVGLLNFFNLPYVDNNLIEMTKALKILYVLFRVVGFSVVSGC